MPLHNSNGIVIKYVCIWYVCFTPPAKAGFVFYEVTAVTVLPDNQYAGISKRKVVTNCFALSFSTANESNSSARPQMEVNDGSTSVSLSGVSGKAPVSAWE